MKPLDQKYEVQYRTRNATYSILLVSKDAILVDEIWLQVLQM